MKCVFCGHSEEDHTQPGTFFRPCLNENCECDDYEEDVTSGEEEDE